MGNTKKCSCCGRELTESSFGSYYSKQNGKSYLNSRCKECNRTAATEWANENRDKYLARLKEYRTTHKDERHADWVKRLADKEKHSRDLQKKREHYQRNKNEIMEYQKQYKQDHPEYEAKCRQKRRAEKKGLPHTFTEEEWIAAKNEFGQSCAYCGIKTALAQDHFIPLSKGGGYTRDNIVPACRKCNSSKNDSMFSDWYRTQVYYNEERERHILEYLGRQT